MELATAGVNGPGKKKVGNRDKKSTPSQNPPLSRGGSVLLVQAIVGTPPATAECIIDRDCPREDQMCHNAFWFCPENGDPGWWVEGTCR